jgi:hypothetical protein
VNRRPAGAPGPGRRPAVVTALAGLGLAALAGCAEIGPPPGGPPDTTPPYVLAARPESLATRIDPASEFAITFSEKVDRRGVRDWLFVNPYRPIAHYDWDGPTLTIRLAQGFPADTTVQVFLGSGVADRAGLPLYPPFARLVTTGDSIAPGVIAGRIKSSRLGTPVGPAAAAPGGPTPGTAAAIPPVGGARAATTPRRPTSVPRFARWVWLFRAGPDTLPDPRVETPYWVSEADPEGNFRLEGLPLGVPFRLVALYDGDRSRGAEGTGDYWTFDADTLALTAALPRIEGRQVFLVDPKSPGRLAGRVVPPPDSTLADSVVVGVLAARREAGVDSLVMPWPPVRIDRTVRVDRGGAWTLSPLEPARYRVACWLDRNRNDRYDAGEPIGAWLERDVAADTETTELELARPAGP